MLIEFIIAATIVGSIVLLAIALIWEVHHPRQGQRRHSQLTPQFLWNALANQWFWISLGGTLLSRLAYFNPSTAIAVLLLISLYLVLSRQQRQPQRPFTYQPPRYWSPTYQPPRHRPPSSLQRPSFQSKQPSYQPPKQFPSHQPPKQPTYQPAASLTKIEPPKSFPPQILHRQELHRKLMSLVHNEKTALRLVNDVLKRNPGSSVEWCYEKAIYDVLRDRR
jgi:hypothetical protein